MVNIVRVAVLLPCLLMAFHLIFANDWECVILKNDETDLVSLVASAQLPFFHHEDTHAHNNEASEEGPP